MFRFKKLLTYRRRIQMWSEDTRTRWQYSKVDGRRQLAAAGPPLGLARRGREDNLEVLERTKLSSDPPLPASLFNRFWLAIIAVKLVIITKDRDHFRPGKQQILNKTIVSPVTLRRLGLNIRIELTLDSLLKLTSFLPLISSACGACL